MDVKAILKKRIENCDNCDVDDQPDPDEACRMCEESAAREGRAIGVSQATDQMLKIRSLIKAGYRFESNDLTHWQWQALVEIDQAIEKHRAEQIKKPESG